MKIWMASLMFILSTTAMADWKAVSGNEENLYWLLEKDTAKLLITRPDGLNAATTQECFNSLGQSGSNRYDIVKGAGRSNSVLVIDTIGARYVPCKLQEGIDCFCGLTTTFHQGGKMAPSAPMNLR